MYGTPVLRDGREGDEAMDEVKRTYRDVETNVKKGVRGIDGTDPKDYVGNTGDEIGKPPGRASHDA